MSIAFLWLVARGCALLCSARTQALNATIKQSKCLENRWKSREQPTATPPAPSSNSNSQQPTETAWPLSALLAGNKWKFNVKCAYQRLSLHSASKDHTLDAAEPNEEEAWHKRQQRRHAEWGSWVSSCATEGPLWSV